MKRKEFLKTAIGGGMALSLAPNLFFAEQYNHLNNKGLKKLTILHTNDQHSRIEPFDASYTRNPNQGGFARRATLILKFASRIKMSFC